MSSEFLNKMEFGAGQVRHYNKEKKRGTKPLFYLNFEPIRFDTFRYCFWKIMSIS